MLAETLRARWVFAAFVPLLALMDEGVSFQTLARREALVALRAGEFDLVFGVRGKHVAIEVLLVGVGFVTSFVGTFVGTFVVVGSEVGEESGWAVEFLRAAWYRAGDRLLFRGEFPTGGGRDVGYDGGGS